MEPKRWIYGFTKTENDDDDELNLLITKASGAAKVYILYAENDMPSPSIYSSTIQISEAAGNYSVKLKGKNQRISFNRVNYGYFNEAANAVTLSMQVSDDEIKTTYTNTSTTNTSTSTTNTSTGTNNTTNNGPNNERNTSTPYYYDPNYS